MAAPFGPRFRLSAALFAALRGGLTGGVGFRECLADGPDRNCSSPNNLRQIGAPANGVSDALGGSLCCVLVLQQATCYPNTPSHSFYQPEPPLRQRQAVLADGGVLAGRVHRPPDGAAVSLRHAVGEFRNPKRIPRRTKAAQHVAMLVARLGGSKRWQGERRHARFHNDWYWEFRPGVPRGGRRYRGTARLSGTDGICQLHRGGRRASRCSAAGFCLRDGVGRRCATC